MKRKRKVKKLRKLRHKWTIEPTQDVTAYYDPEVLNELERMMIKYSLIVGSHWVAYEEHFNG